MAKIMRKVRVGSVVRTGMEKTAVVETVWKQRHRLYRKQMRRVARYRVHDPLNQCQVGDVVRIEETRPISKTKHWRLMEILQSRQIAEVAPMELEADAEIPVADAEVEQPEDLAEDASAVLQAEETDQEIETETETETGDSGAADPVDEDGPAVDETSGETGQAAGEEEAQK